MVHRLGLAPQRAGVPFGVGFCLPFRQMTTTHTVTVPGARIHDGILGIEAALGKFMAQAGFDRGEPGPDAHDPEHQASGEWEPSEQDIADSVRMFGYDVLGTTRYRPDVAELLGTSMVEFPGDHGGLLPEPVAFAQVLTSVLTQAPATV